MQPDLVSARRRLMLASPLAAAHGLLFGLAPSGALAAFPGPARYRRLHSFGNADDGISPNAPLTEFADGSLYGSTYGGGGLGVRLGSGTVFRIDPRGGYSVVHRFDRLSGAEPRSAVIQGADGHLYGTAWGGHVHGRGCVYRIRSDGPYEVLHVFTGPEGAAPAAGLVQAADGAFYGSTYAGGEAGGGTLFRITPEGVHTLLRSFDKGPRGITAGLESTLTLGQDGHLVGIAVSVGTQTQGALFRLTLDGEFTWLHAFDWADEFGVFPSGSLCAARDGSFYGRCGAGGQYERGTIFRLEADDRLSLVLANGSGNAWFPGSLTQAEDGHFYGPYVQGGVAVDEGVVRMRADGQVTLVHRIVDPNAGPTGTGPGQVMQASDGRLYGITREGGRYGVGRTAVSGTLYRL